MRLFRKPFEKTYQLNTYALSVTQEDEHMSQPEEVTHSNMDSTNGSAAARGEQDFDSYEERYQLGHEIDRGGMGIVCLAMDMKLNREVAIKILHEKTQNSTVAANRFAFEAKITGQLQHPSIPPVHDVGTLSDGRPFMAMKLIKGRTLDDLLRSREEPTKDWHRFLQIFEQICQAVAYAHSRNIIHRDLKPSNVMVGAFGEVQVMDWGLAKIVGSGVTFKANPASNDETQAWTGSSPTPSHDSHTVAGSLIGTPAYAPPEQVAGEIEKTDKRADVFGLGAVLAVILTGKPPYVSSNPDQIRVMALRGNLSECLARLDSSQAESELISICKSCLEFEPDQRPKDASELANSIARFRITSEERAQQAEIEKVRVQAEVKAAQSRATERHKRLKTVLFSAILMTVAVVGFLIYIVTFQHNANVTLAAEQTKVEQRFETAIRAIETFHKGVSKDVLLATPELQDLRTKLLKESIRFYGDLEKQLIGQTDARSMKTLAEAYEQVGRLTSEIDSKPQALEIHRKALAIRRDLDKARPGNDEIRLQLARSLNDIGVLLSTTGDTIGALAQFEEQRDICLSLAETSSSLAVKQTLADAYNEIAILFLAQKNWPDAMTQFQKRLEICQNLVESSPESQENFMALAITHSNMGILCSRSGKFDEAHTWLQKALALLQSKENSNPTDRQLVREIANTHNSIGATYSRMSDYREAIESYKQALSIQKKLALDFPSVTEYEAQQAYIHYNIGEALSKFGDHESALTELDLAKTKLQKLVELHPKVIEFKDNLALLEEFASEVRKSISPN